MTGRSRGIPGQRSRDASSFFALMAKLHQPTSETVQTLAKARRDLYGLLSSAYLQLPEKKTLELKWEPALRLLNDPQKGSEEAFKEIREGLNLVNAHSRGKDQTAEDALTKISMDWTRLFRGVARDGILPPYESLYRPLRPQKKPAQEVNRLFSKMGIQVPEEWHQPSDYIGVELDFMRFLCEKEWNVRDSAGSNALRETIEAEKSFLEDHLALWVPIFCERMLGEAQEKHYRGIAHLTRGLVGFDGRWVPRLLV